jgi:hypothetical protein
VDPYSLPSTLSDGLISAVPLKMTCLVLCETICLGLAVAPLQLNESMKREGNHELSCLQRQQK